MKTSGWTRGKCPLLLATVAVLCLVVCFIVATPAKATESGVVINETNFPDEVFRNEILGNYDEGNDGVLTSELEEITQMYVSERGISNLKGIEYFTKLQSLWCANNNLTSLDVSALKELQSLDCSHNSLKSLNVSGLTELIGLDYSYNNLVCLDLSASTKLDALSTNGNERVICISDENEFDLSNFDGFDASKVGFWSGAEYDAETNTLKNITGNVTYDYNFGGIFAGGFTLVVQQHTDENEDEVCDNCGSEIENSGEEGEEPSPIEPEDYFNWSVVENGIRIDGVSELGLAATELVIPNYIDGKKVVEIADGAFADCNNLESIRFEEENDYYVIENGVIYSKDRTVLHSVTAAYPERTFITPWDVIEIRGMAFANRDLPVLQMECVRKIGKDAFNGCTVESLYIATDVAEIAAGAFRGLDSLDMSFADTIGFSFSSESPFTITNGMIMTKDGTRVLFQIYKQDTVTEVKIPNSVTTIDAYAFEECPNLELIRIPASVIEIGENVFAEDSRVTISTPQNSYAVAYAEQNGYEVIEVDPSAGAEGVAINEENFPDDVFRAYVIDSFDFDWNGVLSEEEIASATVVNKERAGITSLKGIEYLTELEELYISQNEIWTLDLNANTKLIDDPFKMRMSQGPKTGEIKGSIGDSITVMLTEFTLPYSNLLEYEDEVGDGELFIRVSIPERLYDTDGNIHWYYRRENCGIGSDFGKTDSNGYYYYKIDVTDNRELIYANTIIDGEVNPADVMPVLSELGEEYFVELVVLDSEVDEWGPVVSTPIVIEDTKVFLKDLESVVDYRVTNEYTVDFTQLVGEDKVARIIGVEGGVLENGVATFCPVESRFGAIEVVLGTTYMYYTGNGSNLDVHFSFENLISLDDCTEVPDGFEEEFESVEDLKEHIHKDMHKDDKKQHKHQQMFDAKLWSVGDDCKWFNIAPEDFPVEGVDVFIPYPVGTDKNTDFKIAHVFEHDCNGYQKGHIEYPHVFREESGIRFRVMGLSPIMLAYGEEDVAEPTPSLSPTPTVTPSPSPTPTVTPSPSPTPTVTPSPSPTPTVTPSPSPTPTPAIDPVEAFVERMYTLIMNRPADSGLEYWVGELKSGAKTGAEVAAGFVLSEEFLAKEMTNEAFIQIMYQTFFDREADEGGLAWWLDAMENGKSKQVAFAGFVNSDEFGEVCAAYGITQGSVTLPEEPTVREFVKRLYSEIMGRDADEGGLSYWVGELEGQRTSGAEAAGGFILSEEFQGKEMTNAEYIGIMYRTFFGREADEGGLAWWLDAMESGESKWKVFAGFANSDEFGELCETYGIIQGSITEPTEDPAPAPTVSEFVKRLYSEIMGRDADEGGLSYWVGELEGQKQTGAQAAGGFILSEEFQAREMTNAEYIRIMYRTFFGREADEGGLAWWLDAMENGTSKFIAFAGFANSDEFGELCEMYGIEQGSVGVE